MVGQGGRPGAAPLGLPGGDRPSRQGDRDGGQGGRDGAAGVGQRGRSEPATDAIARRLRQRAHRGARLSARRKRRKPSPEPASRRLATRTRRNDWRPTTAYGSAAIVRGELPSMRAHAAAFLSDVEARPDSPEAGVAHRAAGLTRWFAGEYREARDHFERALALFQPGRDDDLAFRFGQDAGVAAMGLSGDCVMAARRGRSRDFAHRPHADADGGPHPCRHARGWKNCTRPCSN